MFEKAFTIPEIILIAGTRVALGAGVGLLIGGRISRDAANGAGLALLAFGAMTTIPLAIGVAGKPRLVEKRAA